MANQEFQKTKIVATIGPASSSYEMLAKLIKEGVDIFRLNFSHGNHSDHEKVISNIHKLNKELNTHIGILADLQGPKIRIGNIKGGKLKVKASDTVTLTNNECEGTIDGIYMNYNRFPKDVKAGELILIDDGKLQFTVLSTNNLDTVKLRCDYGGFLKPNKGVNLPNTKVSLPSLTEKDLRDLDFIVTQKVHWVALSFVRSPKDMDCLRAILDKNNHEAKIIAKIEKPEAIKKIDKIIKKSNGIMIARGDLGIEVPLEQLPILQKSIIKKCRQKARPVIVATQMLDSMIENPLPTRAEITDVANAVFDGADAVMLSGETAVGNHPCKVVEYMTKIIAQAESATSGTFIQPYLTSKSRTFLSDAVCMNAANLAKEVGAVGILGMTSSGYTAFKVSSFRPTCNIFIFSDNSERLKSLNLVWGVQCFSYEEFSSTDKTFEDVLEILKEKNMISKGDIVINTASMPVHKRFRTNMLKLSVVE